MRHKVQFLGVIAYFVLVIVVGITAVLFNLSYVEISTILVSIGEIDRVHEFKTQFFTPSTFYGLRCGMLLLSVVLLRLRKHLQQYLKNIGLFFYWLKERLQHSFESLTQQQKMTVVVVSGVFLLVRLLFVNYWEYYEDEAFSYQYLVSKGFLTTISYYPGPNNHVLYNVLCVPLHYVGLAEVWVMRLPSVIISGLTFYVALISLKKQFGFQKALLTAVLMQVAFNYFLYSFQGRGYVLLVLLVVLTLYSFLQLEKETTWQYQTLFVCSAVMGFYTIPVFLYPFSSIVVFALLRNRKDFKNIVVLGLSIVTGVFICYAPIVLVSGYKAIIANDWVKPMPFLVVVRQYPNYLLGLNDWLWDLPKYGVHVSSVLIGLVLIKYKSQKWLWLALIGFVVPLLGLLVQGVLPFPRIWIYWCIVQALGVSVVLYSIRSKSVFFLLILIYILLQGYSFWILL